MRAFFVVVFGVSYAIAFAQAAVSKPDGNDWLYVDHDLAGTRHSPLKQAAATPPSPSSASEENKVCQPVLGTDWPYGLPDHRSCLSLDCFGGWPRGAMADDVVERGSSGG
jgi:hypothetical protein